MPKRSEKYTLNAANARLKASGARVHLKMHGNRIWMVATLPPRPGSSRPRPYQQKIATGQLDNRDGVRNAEASANRLGLAIAAWRAARLDRNAFDWSPYLSKQRQKGTVISDAIAEFEAHYRQTHSLKNSTWRDQWARVFRKLPQGQQLTPEVLCRLALSSARDTRTRMQHCRALQHLADFHGVPVDLLQYKGNYGPSKVQPRELPTDAEISYWWDKIPNPNWRWIYGILAAGGLRPHEAFFSQWRDGGFEVLKGKTGYRELTTDEFFYPEWIESWNLQSQRLPSIDAEAAYEKQRLGERVSRQFKRYGVPFSAYTLRHCHAIRMALFGIPPTVAARIMGHTVDVHMKTYHKWITEAQHRQAVERAMKASDRPCAPELPAP